MLLDLLAASGMRPAPTPAILDVGGGFGVRYTGEPRSTSTSWPAACSSACARAPPAGLAPPIPVAVEPGRSLVANTTVTLYRVGAREGRREGGSSSPSTAACRTTRAPPCTARGTSWPSRARRARRRPGPVTIVGRHCESGDVLADRADMPADLRRGDLLAMAGDGRVHVRDGQRLQPGGPPGRGRCRGPAAAHRGSAARTRPTSTGWRRRRTGSRSRLRSRASTIRPATPRDAARSSRSGRPSSPSGATCAARPAPLRPRCTGARFRHAWTDGEAQVLAVDGAASSATCTCSARSIPPRGTSRRSASRWRPRTAGSGSAPR